MASQSGELDASLELVATKASAPGNQAPAEALAAEARALAAEAPAEQVPGNQVFRDQAQAFTHQAQALANRAQALVAPNDRDLAERETFSYQQIANLLDTKSHYPIHKLALEDWQHTEEYLSKSISRKEGRSAELTNQIYNIFGWFAVFQGVALIAVSHLTESANTELGGAPLCGKTWFPIVLTGFATVVTTSGVLQKFWSLRLLEETIQTDREAKKEIANRTSLLRRQGPRDFNFLKDTDNSVKVTKAKSFRENELLVIASLMIFTVIFILSYFVILYDS